MGFIHVSILKKQGDATTTDGWLMSMAFYSEINGQNNLRALKKKDLMLYIS